MEDLVIKEKFNVLIPKDTIEFIKMFKELEVRMDLIKEDIKEKGLQFLEENNLLDGYEQDGIKLSYHKESTRKQVDTQKMKDEGIYDLYTVEKKYNAYATFSVDYED